MNQRVDARDVLDPNARTRRAFTGRVIGRFERAGPNPWDDYIYIAEPGPTLDVMPGLKVAVEEEGTRFRMRHRGAVVVVEWVAAGAQAPIADTAEALRERFLSECVEVFQNQAGLGAAAVIARALRG